MTHYMEKTLMEFGQSKQGILSAYTASTCEPVDLVIMSSDRLKSLIEADNDITLVFYNLPDVKIVRFESVTSFYDGVAEQVHLAWVIDKI